VKLDKDKKKGKGKGRKAKVAEELASAPKELDGLPEELDDALPEKDENEMVTGEGPESGAAADSAPEELAHVTEQSPEKTTANLMLTDNKTVFDKPEQAENPTEESVPDAADDTVSRIKETREKSPEPGPNTREKKSKSGPGWWLWIVSIIVGLAAAVASFYLWQLNLSQTQQQQASQTKVVAVVQKIEEQSILVRSLQRELDRQTEVSNQRQSALRGELEEQLSELRAHLASQQKRLLSLSTTDRADWLLAEADYLMRLANQRLLMGKEIAGALDLLAAADDIIRELDDSALHSVRKALAENMAALNAAGRLDTDGLYLKLGALARQSEQLRLFKLPELTVGKPEVQVDENWQQRLQTGFSGAVAKLSSYVNYQKRDTIYKPSLAPEYEAAVRQNLRLMFEQAQMALLSSKQKLYEDSLQKASYWLNTYYTLDEAAISSIKMSIDSLAQQKIEIQLPDISSAPRALKDYMSMIHQLSRPNPQQGAEVK